MEPNDIVDHKGEEIAYPKKIIRIRKSEKNKYYVLWGICTDFNLIFIVVF